MKGLSDLRNILVLDAQAARPHSHGYDEIAGLARSVDPGDAEARAGGIRGEDVFSILATSGTTGEPKGVMLSSEQILRAYWDWSDIVGLRAGDPYPIVSPFAHGFGINAGLLASLMRLAQMHPIAVFDPDHALELIENARLSILAGPPALFARLLSRDDLARQDISSLRVAVVGAAAVPTQLVRQMLDRKKEMFIVAGFNAYPAEIENLLARHPVVAQVGVVGIPDPRSGEAGCAFVVAAPGAELTPEPLIAWARASMSNYKVLRRVLIVPELPLTPNGKVDKAALRTRAVEGA